MNSKNDNQGWLLVKSFSSEESTKEIPRSSSVRKPLKSNWYRIVSIMPHVEMYGEGLSGDKHWSINEYSDSHLGWFVLDAVGSNG